jgi:chromosome segregation ATPase
MDKVANNFNATSTVDDKMKQLNKDLKSKGENVMASTEEVQETGHELTNELDKILGNLRQVIKKRNNKIADLRAEIDKLEQENTELDAKMNNILSDI